MPAGFKTLVRVLAAMCLLTVVVGAFAASTASWRGVLRDDARTPVSNATVRLHSSGRNQEYSSRTSSNGEFRFDDIAPGEYKLSVEHDGSTCAAEKAVTIREGMSLTAGLRLCSQRAMLRVLSADALPSQGSGGEHLSSEQVSSLPLNARDFS